MAYLIIGAIVIMTGYLVWRGSGSLWTACIGSIVLPLSAFIALGLLFGKATLQHLSGPWLLALFLGFSALLILARS